MGSRTRRKISRVPPVPIHGEVAEAQDAAAQALLDRDGLGPW
jgi:hypothetical protein